MAKQTKTKTDSRDSASNTGRDDIRVDKATGFTIVNGTTLVCVVDGGSPMSASR